jgi:23S rRNA (uracil1939-C5)-methyltransferase
MKLTIEKGIYGGAGLARAEGKAIFVPFALAGEIVEAQVTSDRGSYAEAELISILEPSAERTFPACRYFSDCGGCHYQHATYAEQLEIKKHILLESLERARLSELPEICTLSSDPLYYRNRSRFHIDRATSKLCYKKRASHANLPIDVCPISAPILEHALQVFNVNSSMWQLGKSFDEIEFFTNADQSATLATLTTSGSAQSAKHALENLWPQLNNEIPAITGAAVLSAERGKQGSKLFAKVGEQSLTYTAAGHSYRVSIGSFFQVNRSLLNPLVEHVTTDVSGKLAWDLYAGVGLFARVLLSSFDQVVAVEAAASSVQDLRYNLSAGRHRVVAATTLDFLRRAQTSQKDQPDFVIVDPPRAGLGKDVTALLAGIRPTHITYVSCDPATLSRDLKSLVDSGYSLSQLHMVDMFPQTFHLESVAKLTLS